MQDAIDLEVELVAATEVQVQERSLVHGKAG